MKKNTLLPFVFLTVTLVLANCSSPGEDDGLQGRLTISGAWAIYPMMIRWSEVFSEQNPGVQFDISAGGAGKGMADALGGAVDIGMVSRDIHPQETDQGAFWVSVTKDAVFLTVNADNPVWEDLHQQGVSRQTLEKIYISGEITTWGQVVGRPEISDPIHIFTRSDACGAASTWAGYLGSEQEDLLGIGVYGDPGVLDAVIKDPMGIGFNNLNYAFDFNTGLPVTGAQVVPLDINGNNLADPEEIYDTKDAAVEAVARGRYPSPPTRDLNLVTLGQPSGLTQTFLTWVLNEGQQYVAEMGYVALPQDRLNLELEKLNP
ncbi:MAG: substrate-binding domain-containing protein [Anaerolineales bacterium]|nr:substrate-binding domain-containing protein [Anaerolineales bacterium]